MTKRFRSSCTPLGATYYVAPAASGGSDSNPGTLSSPFLTVNHGLSVLTAGATLYLRAGNYNEHIANGAIPTGSAGQPVTVAGYPGETATLKPEGVTNAASRGIDIEGDYQYITLRDFTLDGINSQSVATTHGDGIKLSHSGSGAFLGARFITLQNLIVKNFRGNGVLITQDTSQTSSSVHDILLDGCEIVNNGYPLTNGGGLAGAGHGVYLEANGLTVQNCNIHANGEYGIQVYSEETGALTTNSGNSVVIRNNLLHDNGFGLHSDLSAAVGWGVILAIGASAQVYNNLVYGNYGGGLQVTWSGSSAAHCDAAALSFNSVYNNNLVGGNHGIEVDAHATSCTVKDNASHGNSGDQSVSTSSAGSSEDYNVYGTRSGIAQGAHSVIGDPSWVSPATGDFHLNGGSPCHNAGITLGSIAVDYAGSTRGSPPDVGAYED